MKTQTEILQELFNSFKKLSNKSFDEYSETKAKGNDLLTESLQLAYAHAYYQAADFVSFKAAQEGIIIPLINLKYKDYADGINQETVIN